MKKYLNLTSLSLALLFICMVFFSGCETLKGAAGGFKRDWDNWTKWDEGFQEALW